ncbi:MAG TPA: energy transducer TonB [Vicinamibacteria bacterium]|nr:energy transducer TonB [Vicinamibacteria bacterium]
MSPERDFFVDTETLAFRTSGFRNDRKRAVVGSGLIHLAVLLLLVAGPLGKWLSTDEIPLGVTVRFYEPGGEGEGGGGGGGGEHGKRPTAYIPVKVHPPPEPAPEPRRAPVAPRKPRPLDFSDLEVPDLPTETALFFGVFSPDATEFPGLSLTDGREFGGLDIEPSSGTGGGIGGGTGTGVGTGEGWGVGPGRGGGFGGGDYRPGGWDIDPVPIFQPDTVYPAQAREKMVAGEVILQVLVKLDGSTEVIRVIKSLPYCVEAAKENAKRWRWKPALKNGKPVEAVGIITVKFDLFAQGNARS